MSKRHFAAKRHDIITRELELLARELRDLTGELDVEGEWPDSLVAIARVAGSEAALQLCDHSGGLSRIYVPKKPRVDHPWAQLIGLEAHAAICKEFGGQQIELPRFRYRGLKKKAILELCDTGISNREIARRTRSTERYVTQVLADVRNSKRQLKLFGGS
jgi:hypothetical protein